MCQPVRAALSPPPAPSKEAARPQLDAKPLSFIRVAAQALGGGRPPQPRWGTRPLCLGFRPGAGFARRSWPRLEKYK